MIKIIADKCVGCTACVKVCPFSAITMVNKKAVIDLEKCTLCKVCIPSCTFKAIVFEEEEPVVSRDLSGYKGVWVFGELTREYKPASVVYELLSKGRELAQALGTYTGVMVVGPQKARESLQSLQDYGAEKVFLITDERFKHYISDLYAQACVQLVERHKPDIILAGATTIGRSLMPRLAVKLQTGLTADCTELHIDAQERLLIQTRPAFGGNIMACIITKRTKPQMATVRHRVMKAVPVKGRPAKMEIIEDECGNHTSSVQFLRFIREEISSVNLAEADIIVSGGRGIGSKEHFALIEELAKTLNAAVGASRAAVDSGWMPYSHQVGQTGTTVSPKVYIACGISGQIQHLVGMQSSEVIIAINKDPDAPIFKIADHGIVGDLFKVIPALIKRFNANASHVSRHT